MGSSVRGAIDMVRLARGLARLRGEDPPGRAVAARRRGRGPLGPRPGPRGPGPHGRGGDRRTARPGAEPGLRAGAGESRRPAGRSAGRTAWRPESEADARQRIRRQARRTLDRQRLAAAHAAVSSRFRPRWGGSTRRRSASQLRRDGDAALALLADLAVATDPALRRQARRLAQRLLPALGRAASRAGAGRPEDRGPGWSAGGRSRRRSHARAKPRSTSPGCPRPRGTSVRRRTARRCLLVDRSGSMSGHAVALAAVAAAAVVTASGERLRCSVVAFASEPLVLLSACPCDRPARSSTTCSRCAVTAGLTLRGRCGSPPDSSSECRRGDARRCCCQTRFTPRARTRCPPRAPLDCLHVLGTSAEPDAVAAGKALARRGRGSLPAGDDAGRDDGRRSQVVLA